MFPSIIKATIAIAFFGSLAQAALAWNKPGHMVSGAIAYQVLKEDSRETLKKVIALLKEHPYYESTWEPRLHRIPAEDQDLFLFMMTARWPDDARNDEEFHHAEWHYINFPFKPKGQPQRVKTAEPDHNNILRAFAHNLQILKMATNDAENRAAALAWIFHLVGDVHQPLHTAALFTTDFPEGDRGGTRFNIRVDDDSSVISLHKFWDDLILGSDRVRTVKNRAAALLLRKEFARKQLGELGELEFDKWAAESFKLAKEVTYRNGQLPGSPDRRDAPVLPDDYADTVQPIAERRIVLAGYRIAQLLKKAME